MDKKWGLRIVLFLAGFVGCYLFLCYHPPLMIKLEAPPFKYFVASISHGAVGKSIVSAAAGALLVGAQLLIQKLMKK